MIFYILMESFTNLEKKIASFCSFCMNFLWTQLQISFQNVLIIPPVTPHSTIFGFTDHKVNHNLINQILFMLKYYVYDTRENGSLDLKVLKRNIKKYWKTKKCQQTRKMKTFWTKMETIVRKHKEHILKYIAVRQLGGGKVRFFILLYLILP